MEHPEYHLNVFVNCPFDNDYKPLMQAVIFAIHDCGFIARSALESDNGAVVRLTKIQNIIEECRYGIHDISRIQLSERSGLPRFNMPLELGIFLGAKSFGGDTHKSKSCMIFEKEQYRYQRFCSDIAGQDIHAHNGQPEIALVEVRNWLGNNQKVDLGVIPGGKTMISRFREFQDNLPVLCKRTFLHVDELMFSEYTMLIAKWLQAHPITEV